MLRRTLNVYGTGVVATLPLLLLGEAEAHRQQFRPMNDLRSLFRDLIELDDLLEHRFSAAVPSELISTEQLENFRQRVAESFNYDKTAGYTVRQRWYRATDESDAALNGVFSVEPWVSAFLWPLSIPPLLISGVVAEIGHERVHWLEDRASVATDRVLEQAVTEMELPEEARPMFDQAKKLIIPNIGRLVRLFVWMPPAIIHEAVIAAGVAESPRSVESVGAAEEPTGEHSPE